MANRPRTEQTKDAIGTAGEGINGNGTSQTNQVASNDFPTDLQNLSEADKKKWFRVEEVGSGRSILKVRPELLNLPDEVGEPGFLEKTCGYKVPLNQNRTLVFDQDI